MRLTLRTLLAWLDDTLQPTRVREIGAQVAESPFAQELTERIHRVTRQRRLSVPSSSGPDGTDPNVVASYLDNDLDHETVAEYEKKCLTSDVNLAEVASVHQILSLLGQKVKVPAAARARMYQLVKGRETLRPRPAETKRAAAPEPLTKPIQPWVVAEEPRRRWFERFGPIAAGVALIALSLLTASWSLGPPQREGLPPLPGMGEPAGKDAIAPNPADQVAVNPMRDGSEELELSPALDVRTPGSDKSASTGADAGQVPKAALPGEPQVAKTTDSNAGSNESAAPRTLPSESSGLAETAGGILLRYNVDQREWVRLTGPTAVSRTDRLLCLSPFRATLTLGKVPSVLLGETEVRILSQSTDKVPAIELTLGRLLLRHPPSGSLKVGFSGRTVTLEVSPASSVVLERTERRVYGSKVSQSPPLVVYCTEGDVAVNGDGKQESLTASDAVVIDAAGGVKQTAIDTPPAWATDADPSPQELQIREKFVRMFHPGRPVLTEIVAASDDENADIKRLSISALKALGDPSLLMPILSRKDDPVARKSALEAIRAYMALGPDAATRVRNQLAEEFGDDTASFVEKMLVGLSAEEASNSQIFERLVALLGPEQESVGVRELALDTLKQLTGRDDLGYDPDHADGKGLSAWKDLQKQGKRRFSPSRGKAQ